MIRQMTRTDDFDAIGKNENVSVFERVLLEKTLVNNEGFGQKRPKKFQKKNLEIFRKISAFFSENFLEKGRFFASFFL